MAEVVCPTIDHILNENECTENLAGLSEVVYVGIKSDLSKPLTLTDNVYSGLTFKAGKGLYKFECAEETQGIVGSSLNRRKGYKQTLDFAIDSVNKLISKIARGMNNLDVFFVVPDGDLFQIMYSKNRKCKADADGIQTNTGKAATDDRRTTFSYTLQPVDYPNYYVDITDIESLLEGNTVES